MHVEDQIMSVPRAPRAAATILVVEDEPMLRLAISKSLRKNGFTVMEASDGFAALDRVRDQSQDIDLILMDLMISGSPVSEVSAEARRFRPGIKLILTSAYDLEMAPTSIDAINATAFIRKPFHLHELTRLLVQTLAL
jgi:two-component system, cell cycle sensor histidine kinase and response regulator CckA